MFESTQDNPKNRVTLFSIFGPTYVPEDHAEKSLIKLPKIPWPDSGAIGVWAGIYVVLAAIVLLTGGAAAKLIELAAMFAD